MPAVYNSLKCSSFAAKTGIARLEKQIADSKPDILKYVSAMLITQGLAIIGIIGSLIFWLHK